MCTPLTTDYIHIIFWQILIFGYIVQHLAYEYAKRGAHLALAARREKSLQEVADRAREYGSPDVLVIRADVSKVEDCKRIVNVTMDHFGRGMGNG